MIAFIHDKFSFSKREILERAKLYGFSDPLPVELFLWDCEIAAQLQRENENLVLKGGAAAQLHIPAEMQRGSVDVDIACNLTKNELTEILSRIHEQNPTIEFEKYTPKQPKKEINMVTYLARTPPILPSDGNRPREVKIDFLLENLDLPIATMTNVETFAVRIKKLRCYSATSLIGEKLLTLAETTIGIADSADIPKQIYDLSVLSETHIPTPKQFSELTDVIKKVTPLEAKYRGLKTSISEVLEDVKRTLDKYSLLDTAGANPEIKRNLNNFQQFYVSASQRRPLYDWCARALRLRFLSELLKAIIEKKTNAEEAGNNYMLAVQTASLLATFSGRKIKDSNKQLMASADKKIPYFKNLKGKPLQRVFWEVLSQDNLDTIHKSVKTQAA